MPDKSIPWKYFVLLAIGLMVLWSCGGAPLKVEPVDKSGNPTEMVDELGKELAEAHTEQIDVLSPTWFKRAVASHTEARKGLERGDALTGILENIAKGKAQLSQARVVAIRSRDQLDETILSRDAARAVDAQQFKDYADVESAFLKLTAAMDKGDFDYARNNRKSVSERFRALELRSISQSALGEVRQLMKKVEDLRVPKIAPKSFADAQAALQKAEAYIAGNRYNKEGIQQHTDQARFMVQRASAMGEASRNIKEMEPEAVALSIESYLSQVNAQLDGPDVRNLSFKEQTQAILAEAAAVQATAKQIEEKNALIQSLNARLSDLEGTSQRVKYDKDRLAAEKRFNELFTAVQGTFRPHEAEVYKQLDTLVIRLKGIQFPVGQSVVQPASYPLLTKVQDAIRTFGQPEVIIEGHTDSTGSAQNNQILSERRAESVKQYLVANGTLSSSKIRAVGYGFSRPIAPNETAAGRAQNRRIDVLIKPQMK